VEHLRHLFNDYECTRCHKKFKVLIPGSLKEDNQYGASVQVMAAVMTNEGYVSINRTSEIMSDITGNEINLSQGFIVKVNKRLT
jgi:transposase-like protein